MKKIFSIILILFFIFLISANSIYADDANLKPEWWNSAFNWFNSSSSASSTEVSNALTGILNFIKAAGNIVFFAITVVLGVKYIWGSVESKSSIKESLVTLVVAALFFYGYSTITGLFDAKTLFVTSSAETSIGNIYNIVLYICNVLAIAGVVFIGVKYMLAGASGRAELKTKSVPVILGIIMVYSTLTFLTLITKLI